MAAVLPLKLNAPDFQQFQSGDFLGEIHGGTAQTSYSTGDTLYASGANTLSKLTIGSSGNVLTVAGGVPTWAAPAAGSYITLALTNGNGGTINQGQLVYFNGTNDTVDLAKADNITTSRVIGAVYDSSIATTATGNIIITGLAPAALSGATAGTVYYLSDATAGLATTTAPSTAGHSVIKVGIAADATKLFLQIDPITRL
jgi:hypothetical protein